MPILPAPTSARRPALSQRVARISACLLLMVVGNSVPTLAFAGGAIVKCVDAAGKVTLTDGQCGDGDGVVLVAASADSAPESTATGTAALPRARASLQRISMSAAPVQHDAWINPRPRSKMLAGDAATLRAARSSLQVLDDAAASSRQQRLAGLN